MESHIAIRLWAAKKYKIDVDKIRAIEFYADMNNQSCGCHPTWEPELEISIYGYEKTLHVDRIHRNNIDITQIIEEILEVRDHGENNSNVSASGGAHTD
jgi:hypothetical protein